MCVCIFFVMLPFPAAVAAAVVGVAVVTPVIALAWDVSSMLKKRRDEFTAFRSCRAPGDIEDWRSAMRETSRVEEAMISKWGGVLGKIVTSWRAN